MPTPSQVAQVDPFQDPLIAKYRRAWDRIQAEQAALADDPVHLARSNRLREMGERITDIVFELDDEAASWISGQFPKIYGAGMSAGAEAAGTSPIWTAIHQEAVEELAFKLFDDLLSATEGVTGSAKNLIRTIARDEALQKAIEGRTAKQAGREMQRILESHGMTSVVYKNGSRHGLAEYTQMAIRTTTAQAYNVGTLNGAPEVQFFEVFDGPGCGWTFHGSPDQALGSIRSRDECLAWPISHPNCRRAFGARPDVTSQSQIQELEGNPLTVGAGQTTIGQLSAQNASDALRARRGPSRPTLAKREARKAKRAQRELAEPDALPDMAPDALDSVIDEKKFEAPGKAFPPGVKNRGYSRKVNVPTIPDLVDAGWDPKDVVTEWERLTRNAGNVERRARNKLKQQGHAVDPGPVGPEPFKPKPDDSWVDDLIRQDESGASLSPTILSDRSTGMGGGPKHWYDRMEFDTPPPGLKPLAAAPASVSWDPWIPVRDVNIQGYNVKNGIAFRRNDRSYLLELEPGEAIDAVAFAKLQKHADTVDQAMGSVPKHLQHHQRGVAVLKGKNPADAHWAKEYDTPGFTSAATGGNGGMTFWATEPRPGTILHEFGHNLDTGISPGFRLSDGAKWTDASGLDELSNEYFKKNGFQGSIPGHEITPGSHGVTTYGANNAKEDFAESVRLYLADRHNGYLGYTGQPPVSVRFADVFPERAKYLDNRFGFDTNFETPFRIAQRDKAVKAYVDSDGKLDFYDVVDKYGGLDHDEIQRILNELGPAALNVKKAEELAKAAEAAAALEKQKLVESVKYENLSLGDKTSIGLKKKNAYNKAIKEGKDEATALQIADDVYQRELKTKLDGLAREYGLEPGDIFNHSNVGSGVMDPTWNEATNKKGTTFLTSGGKTVHPKSIAQGHPAAQAKANIAAELASRLNNEKDWEIFRDAMKAEGRADPGPFYAEAQMGGAAQMRQKALDREVSARVQKWAGTSGDSDVEAIAMQMAIKDEFNVTGSAYIGTQASVEKSAASQYAATGAFYRRFARVMYEHTQDELAREGVREVSVYRGMRLNSGIEWGRPGQRRPLLQPANSWSTKARTSENFGDIRFTATIPANRILGSCRTGFGCLNEYEFVILDSEGLATVGTFRDPL